MATNNYFSEKQKVRKRGHIYEAGTGEAWTSQKSKARARSFVSASASFRTFLVKDSCVFNGPLGRTLSLFSQNVHSAHSLCSALLCLLALLTYSVHRLAQSLRWFPCGTVEIHEYEFMLKTFWREWKRHLSSLETSSHSWVCLQWWQQSRIFLLPLFVAGIHKSQPTHKELRKVS